MTTFNISFANAKAAEIESGVIRYEFTTEQETEAAVMECIENGVKFNTCGRCSLVVYQPAETYEVCYGEGYEEEDGESNSIMTAPELEDAKQVAEGESESNRNVMTVCRTSDRAVVARYDNTMKTNNTATPANESEANELTEAAHLLDIYIYNECEIYDKHIAPAIDKVAAMIRSNARSAKGGNWQITAAAISEEPHIKKAVSLATQIVRKQDWMEPTYFDKKAARLSLAAYVIESAQYQATAV